MNNVFQSEIAGKTDFSAIRYAQCWEDADILLNALDIQPGHVCLSIASAGDNTLAMLSRNPARVIAIDLNPAQLACLELRVAAYRVLSHTELLELIGSVPSHRRERLYRRCRHNLALPVRDFWDARPSDINQGIGHIGKFERYLALFRQRILPLIHSPERTRHLLETKTVRQRCDFYERQWNNWRWHLLFRLFFCRLVVGRLGRDPSFFDYVEGNVANRLLARARYALTALNPAENPYLQWIITGRHVTALPFALRPGNFERIRANLDRLEWHCQSFEEFMSSNNNHVIDRYNLSNIFEYMSSQHYYGVLLRLVTHCRPGSRLVYWNMLVPRSRPDSLAAHLRPLSSLAQQLHRADKAFFYSNIVVEEMVGQGI